MRRLILQMSVSLDGFVAAEDGTDWGYEREDEGTRAWKLASVSAAGAHLMGRKSYEDMASYWPTSDSVYAPAMNEIPKIVFSKTLETAEWPESRIAAGDLADEVVAIKSEPGKDVIAYGGATFARALVRERLVDEYRLVIQPAALGAGLPLFTELRGPLHLELAEAHSYPTGAAIHVYRPRTAG